MARRYGMESKIAGIRSVGFALPDIAANRDQMVQNFIAQARALIQEEGAEVIIPMGITQCPVHIQTGLAAGTARRSSGGRIRRTDSHGGAAGRSWFKDRVGCVGLGRILSKPSRVGLKIQCSATVEGTVVSDVKRSRCGRAWTVVVSVKRDREDRIERSTRTRIRVSTYLR